MKRVIVSAVAVGLVCGAALLAQGFNLRTGSWSFTMTIKGMAMDGLPPDVRAQLEKELSKPQTFTSCITAEDLKNMNLGKTDDSDGEKCKTTSSKITGTAADITRQCTGDEAGTETSHFEAPTPQTLTGIVTKKTAQGTSTMNLTGKWVAAKCSE
jgi:hypothetical protein